jgi:hypothetical protein
MCRNSYSIFKQKDDLKNVSACAEEQFGVDPLVLNFSALVIGLLGTLLIGMAAILLSRSLCLPV